jgi:hypothetical protein
VVFQIHLEAGATYRMLERAPMRSAADLSSSEVGKVAAAGTVAASHGYHGYGFVQRWSQEKRAKNWWRFPGFLVFLFRTTLGIDWS